MTHRDLQTLPRPERIEFEPACLSDETLREFAEQFSDLARASGEGDLYTWLCGRINELYRRRNVLAEREGER